MPALCLPSVFFGPHDTALGDRTVTSVLQVTQPKLLRSMGNGDGDLFVMFLEDRVLQI